MSTPTEYRLLKERHEALVDGMTALLDDLRRYADPHDLNDPRNPRHVSVGLMGIRLRALLEGDTR